MLYWKCLFGLIAMSVAYSAEIAPGYTIIEVFGAQDYKIRENDNKVNVSLYYECRCHACVDFHTNTLNTTVTKLAAYINVATYPYGNAETKQENGKTVITCQHGPLECYGNKLHACAIDILKNNTLSVFYNSCLMTGRSTDDDATSHERLIVKDLLNKNIDSLGIDKYHFNVIECGESMGIDAKPIIECTKGKKGDDLLEYNGKETEKHCPDKAGVPWPLINGRVYLDEYNKFLSTICAYLANPPPVCNE